MWGVKVKVGRWKGRVGDEGDVGGMKGRVGK